MSDSSTYSMFYLLLKTSKAFWKLPKSFGDVESFGDSECQIFLLFYVLFTIENFHFWRRRIFRRKWMSDSSSYSMFYLLLKTSKEFWKFCMHFGKFLFLSKFCQLSYFRASTQMLFLYSRSQKMWLLCAI